MTVPLMYAALSRWIDYHRDRVSGGETDTDPIFLTTMAAPISTSTDLWLQVLVLSAQHSVSNSDELNGRDWTLDVDVMNSSAGCGVRLGPPKWYPLGYKLLYQSDIMRSRGPNVVGCMAHS
jgi:hypothetical protein